LVGEARSRRETKLKRQTNIMVRVLERTAKKHRAQVDVQVERAYGMFRFSPRDPVVREVSAAIERIGRHPKLEVTGGGSDANIFNEKGIACIPVGIGYEKIHTTEEFMPVVELGKTAQLVVELAKG
jgi:tripeptide aminopeptidase